MSDSKRPSPSMAVALLALFVALGGTATAAKVLISSSGQIKSGVIQRSDIARDQINSARVADGSLKASDLSKSAQGAMGQPQAFEAFRASGPEDVGENQKATVATLKNLPSGAYAIFAKTVLTAPSDPDGLLMEGDSLGARCVLDTDGDTDEAYALLGSPGSNAPGTLNMQITRSFAGTGSAEIICEVSGQSWRASNTSIIAVRIAPEPRQNVSG